MNRPAKLARVMGLRDVVLLHVVAIVGVRWLLTAGRIGPSSILLWVAAVVLFFVPQGLAVLELSARMPEEGGVYVWAREAFGPFHGFVCGWAYWVNNLVYYPSLIVFIGGNAAFVLGRSYLGLADNTTYQILFSLGILWLAMGLNIVGLRTGRWVQNVGGLATWLVAFILIGLGMATWWSGSGQDPLSGGSLVPALSGSNIALWSSLCFALAGLELAVVMGGEVKNPSRNLPRSILIAAPIIAAIYILGTLAILAAFPASEVNLVTGVVQAIGRMGEAMGIPVVRLAAILIVLGGLGGVGAWLAGTARIPFVIGLDRFLPAALGRIHPRWHTPYIALFVQGIGASVFILVAALGSTVEEAYLVLVDTTIIVYFIPYLYLFAALPVLRRRAAQRETMAEVSDCARETSFRVPGGNAGLAFVVIAGLATTAVSIVLSALPSDVVASPVVFVAKIVGGAGGLMAIGLVFYVSAMRRRTGRRAGT
ncbi:MAG: APC family permease [Longimicrobiales bacterium]